MQETSFSGMTCLPEGKDFFSGLDDEREGESCLLCDGKIMFY